MVKLDQYDRTLDSIVKRVIISVAANPAEVDFFPVLLDLPHSSLAWTRRQNI